MSRTKDATCTEEPSVRWPSTPSPEILYKEFSFFGLSEQVQRRKEMGGGEIKQQWIFLFPSVEGYPVGPKLCILLKP